MSVIYKGDSGTVIRLDCGVDISSATQVKIIAKSPLGTKKEWTGVVDASNYVKYTIAAEDFDVAGTWSLQAYVVMPTWTGRGSWVNIDIKD